MTSFKCPQCGSDSFLNPSIKIFLSPCYHKICETCFARIFSSGSADCPECGTFLRKSNFIYQTFEDVEIERECQIRKFLGSVYSKSEDDFPNEEEYDLYLEDFENEVFRLLELKEDKVLKDRIQEIKRRESGLQNVKDESKRRKKLRGSTHITIEEKVEEPVKIFNALEGLDLKVVDLNGLELPRYYFREYLCTGFTREYILEKCIRSLDSEKI